MNITVGSMWRDSTRYITHALHQFSELADLLNRRADRVTFVFVDGGSTDDTWAHLTLFRETHRTVLVERNDGCPFFPSVDRPERWRHLAWVQNGTLDHLPDNTDVFLYVESDLQWQAPDLVALVDRTVEWPVAAAANVQPSGHWYDTHGTRRNSVRFVAAPPHHADFNGAPLEIDSAGGALAMRAGIARATRVPESGYVGWCDNIRGLGFPIILDPAIRVVHP